MFDDFVGCALGVFVLFLTLTGLVYLGALAWDGVQAHRAYEEIVACEAQIMEARRKPFSAVVTCVPVPTRQDTTTINFGG